MSRIIILAACIAGGALQAIVGSDALSSHAQAAIEITHSPGATELRREALNHLTEEINEWFPIMESEVEEFESSWETAESIEEDWEMCNNYKGDSDTPPCLGLEP